MADRPDYDSRPDTRQHIERVRDFIGVACRNLTYRAMHHDASKLVTPEVEAFDLATPKLRELVYGTDEYRASLAEIRPAIEHHYEVNDHHPEHFPNGVAGMSLMALIEMVCDWRAASERTAQTQTFAENLPINFERYGIEPQLAEIIRNTVTELQL